MLCCPWYAQWRKLKSAGNYEKYNLYSGKDGLQVYMMCELPSNVVLIEEFASYFDGFSIGSNDLTQTTLSVDRDSALLAGCLMNKILR